MGISIFNPHDPHADPTASGLQQDGIGAGPPAAVPPAFQIDVEFDAEPPTGFLFYEFAEGHHVIRRRLEHRLPTIPDRVDFRIDREAVALWESDPRPGQFDPYANQGIHGPGVVWRVAYGWPWTYPGWSGVDQTGTFHDLEQAWALWYGPEWWLASEPDELNVAFPLYFADPLRAEFSPFDPLRPVRLQLHPVGNSIVPGVFDFPEFPDELTLRPFWP